MGAEVIEIAVTVNGVTYERAVEPRLLLVDLIRDELALKGTHIGCEEGVCGACTVEIDGEIVKSCLMFAVQADGRTITTIEGVNVDTGMHPVQAGLAEELGLQCGFCTPGMIMAARALLAANASPKEEEIRYGMVGNICRCTGYHGIVRGIARAAELIRDGAGGDASGSGESR